MDHYLFDYLLVCTLSSVCLRSSITLCFQFKFLWPWWAYSIPIEFFFPDYYLLNVVLECRDLLASRCDSNVYSDIIRDLWVLLIKCISFISFILDPFILGSVNINKNSKLSLIITEGFNWMYNNKYMKKNLSKSTSSVWVVRLIILVDDFSKYYKTTSAPSSPPIQWR